MKQLLTQGIILSRTDYGEADRILTLLTPDYGKLRLLAKGVRRVKSKLAGGIELFSVSHITFIQGRGEMGTLISTRLIRHYGNIAKDIERTMLGYDLTKQLNKTTEDEPEADYFHLLEQAFVALDESSVGLQLVQTWFTAQLLRLSGHTPNLKTDTSGEKLASSNTYDFSFDDMAFARHADGHFAVDDIKLLRLLFSGNAPGVLQKIDGVEKLVKRIAPLVQSQRQIYLH